MAKSNQTKPNKTDILFIPFQILHEEKGVLVSLEKCLKDKCSELQEEVHSLKSGVSLKGSTCLQDKKGNVNYFSLTNRNR